MKWYTPLEKEYAPYKRWEFKWNANASARIQDTLRRIQVERKDIKFYDVSKGGGTLKIPQLVKAQSSMLRNRREPRLCVVGASHALHLMFGFYMMVRLCFSLFYPKGEAHNHLVYRGSPTKWSG